MKSLKRAETAQRRMACSRHTERSGLCYMFLFLALSVLELIKWVICISCPALLLLPCSAKMITNLSSQISPSHKISQLCEIKDAILLRAEQNCMGEKTKGPGAGKQRESWRRWSWGIKNRKHVPAWKLFVILQPQSETFNAS